MTKVCCVCSKVEQQGGWTSDCVLSATQQLSHGYCPVCFEDVMEDLSRFFKKRNTAQLPVVQAVSNCEVADVCAY